MPDGGIDKFEAAQRQLDCAIRLWVADEDSLGIHTLAYAACCLLRDLLGNQKAEVLRKFEGSQRFGEVPNFVKHADRDPDYILNARSKLSGHLTWRCYPTVGGAWAREDARNERLLRSSRSVQAGS
jgi:hypothetical protein